MSDENSPSGSGGAVFVDHGGAVVFGGACVFAYNEVGSGGRGGAIANMGSVVFHASTGHASFTDNSATGEFELVPCRASQLAYFVHCI